MTNELVFLLLVAQTDGESFRIERQDVLQLKECKHLPFPGTLMCLFRRIYDSSLVSRLITQIFACSATED